jgi:tetratricopeptide (TPR) repeat protein
MDSRAEKLWHRGVVHFRQGAMEAAHASFEAFLAREPGSGPGWFRLSLVEARQGRHALAATRAEHSLALDPGHPEVLSHLARCLLRAGAPERARAIAMQALALPRDKPVVLDSLAGVLTRLDEPALALELFDRAIELDPDHASLYFNRALAHRQFGQAEAAERDLEACLARHPGHPKAHWALATLRTQDLAGNHVPRLRRLLDNAMPAQEEVLALALFKELDDLGDTPAAAQALARGLAARTRRRSTDGTPVAAHAALVDEMLASVDARWLRAAEASCEAAPVFVVGLPRSGVSLLGGLLSRHPRLHWLGTQQAWGRRLQAAFGAEGRTLAAGDSERIATLDFNRLGRDYLADVLPAGAKPPIACESTPLDYLQVGFIARALPQARFLHLVRDPVDTCASILFQPGQDHGLAIGDGATAAAWHADYARLMRHWHELLPGRIMDVSYESLVEKPEMMLRVLCSFLGIRYAAALRMGLKLHARSIGRGHRYLAQLPGLGEALARQDRAA